MLRVVTCQLVAVILDLAADGQGGDVKRAVDCCVLLSQWDQAVTLAHEHNIPQIQTLLFKYAAMLLEQHKTMEAVQLYRKVQCAWKTWHMCPSCSFTLPLVLPCFTYAML